MDNDVRSRNDSRLDLLLGRRPCGLVRVQAARWAWDSSLDSKLPDWH